MSDSDSLIFAAYIVARADCAVTAAAVGDVAEECAGLTYFETALLLDRLAGSGLLSLDRAGYRITAVGAERVAVASKSLPYSLRVKADRLARGLRENGARRRAVKTSRNVLRDGGFSVTMTLSDGALEPLSVTMYAPTDADAETLERSFASRAEEVLSLLIKTLAEKRD
ncbi:MAG: DUF4364 family protein [Oscillospiraceae bacterium]|jgi:hypothetical protein|nr:DUF4364 family protein [Oscillospiraceae bacterium]